MNALIPLSCVLLGLGVLILSGKGDFLIAGYNTAKPEKKQQYNVKRMRGLVGGLTFLCIALLWVPLLLGKAEDAKTTLAISVVVMVCCIIAVILMNTWAKKK